MVTWCASPEDALLKYTQEHQSLLSEGIIVERRVALYDIVSEPDRASFPWVPEPSTEHDPRTVSPGHGVVPVEF